MRWSAKREIGILALGLLIAATAGPLSAVKVPDHSSPIGEKEFRHLDLEIPNLYQPVAQLPADLASLTRQDLAALRVGEQNAYFDLRGGRWGTLVPTEPLIPGSGVGNDLSWSQLQMAPPADRRALERAVWDVFLGYLQAHEAELGIDLSELASPGRVTVHEDGDLVQIHAPRVVAGVAVRASFVTAVVKQGNLVLYGTRNWGTIDLSAKDLEGLTPDNAIAVVRDYLADAAPVSSFRREPELVIVPLAAGAALEEVPVGAGYDWRLAWAISPEFPGEIGTWEALVDARSGELLAFVDLNQYGEERTVVGGVYPVSNDGTPPDGVEHTFPMPYADLSDGNSTDYTDSGGNSLSFPTGTITTTLDGLYIRIDDNCGPISESTDGKVLDLGTSGGTDCDVPPGASPGNTHAARTGFYELNRIKEMARGHLPGNAWLQGQLTARTNISPVCNAYWNGSQVLFYRTTALCANTGELAGVLDHEFGHGLDANGANPGISSPGEGIPDVYAALRLGTSCIGRGFRATQCTGYGDPCLNCTGIRDIDWANRQSQTPHDIAWIAAHCGPSHCRSTVYSEAIWDLMTRDLQAAPFNLDLYTSWEITNRLTFLAADVVGLWFQQSGSTGDGCNADSGYMNFLAVDDDDGDLTNGTPHMSAIFAAYDRHGIACPTPPVQNGGCAGAPTTAPVVSGEGLDRGARLTWPAVPGATRYKVYRTEGVFGCDFGKTLVGETTGLEFVDGELHNGMEYYYVVAGFTAADACMGPASSCTTVTARSPIIWVDAGGLGDYVDIQSAVDAAQEGDEIRVVQGVYTTASGDVVTWVAKDLTLQGGYESVGGALKPTVYETVIDGGGVAFRSGVYTSGLTSASTFSGFTLRGGQNGRLNSGAGIHNDHSDLTISHCVFHSNSANWGAGVASWNDSDVTITHSYFHSNWAYYGAAIHNGSGSEATIVNCVFYSNSAAYGGAIRNVSSNAAITNCSFGGNSGTVGNTMHNRFSAPVVLNSILWNGGGEISDNDGLVSTVTYSDVQGGFPGTGNIDADPLFFNVAAGDLRLRFRSPAIDRGTKTGAPADDIIGTRRPQGRGIDMGAYEMRVLIPEPHELD